MLQDELKTATATATPILVRRRWQQCNLAIRVAAKISLEVAAAAAGSAAVAVAGDDVAGTRRMRNQQQNGDRIVTVCNYFCLRRRLIKIKMMHRRWVAVVVAVAAAAAAAVSLPRSATEPEINILNSLTRVHI